MDIPVDIENISLGLEIDRLRREVDFLKEELNRSASIISSLSTAPASSSSSSSAGVTTTTESTISEPVIFSESSASSLNQLATILTLSLQQSSASTNTQQLSSSSTTSLSEPVFSNDIQNITLNLDVERLSRERDYLRYTNTILKSIHRY